MVKDNLKKYETKSRVDSDGNLYSYANDVYRRENRESWFYNGNKKDNKYKNKNIAPLKNGSSYCTFLEKMSLFPNIRLPMMFAFYLENIARKLGLVKENGLENINPN